MSEEKIFNSKIKKMAKDSPVVSKFLNSFGTITNYHVFLDSFCDELGFSFGTTEVLNEKNGKSLGFSSYIKFDNESSWLKKIKTDKGAKFMPFKVCVESMTKDIVYGLMKLENDENYKLVMNNFINSSRKY